MIVFKNGFTENLENAVETRKEEKPNLLQSDETLIHSYLENVKDQNILVLFTNQKKVISTLSSPKFFAAFTISLSAFRFTTSDWIKMARLKAI